MRDREGIDYRVRHAARYQRDDRGAAAAAAAAAVIAARRRVGTFDLISPFEGSGSREIREYGRGAELQRFV